MPTILSVFFENSFWVAILEQIDDGELRVARYIFGAEPSDAEIYEFVQRDYLNLLHHLSAPVSIKQTTRKRLNPKRQQRLIQKQIAETHLTSQSQDALRLERERHKKAKLARKRSATQAEKEVKREQKIRKRKQKHRGH